MNIRVDLILDNEKRSASLLNVKSIIRLAIIIAPLLVIVTVVLGGIGFMHSNVKLNNLKNRWELAEQRQKEAKALRDETAINNRIKNELLGWRASQMPWGEQMVALQRIAPSNMQFIRLNISQTLLLVNNSFPARQFVLTLSGKSKGSAAEANINTFIDTIKSSEIFTVPMEGVSIESFGEDRNEYATREDRVFEIKCTYNAKVFREPRKQQ